MPGGKRPSLPLLSRVAKPLIMLVIGGRSRFRHSVKSISFPRDAAAFDFARNRGLTLSNGSLFARSGDLLVGRGGGGLYLSIGRIIGRFNLPVWPLKGTPNGYDGQ
jgi:hypothetical protein